jgi:ABC-type uncharacterized transport system permease subunit
MVLITISPLRSSVIAGCMGSRRQLPTEAESSVLAGLVGTLRLVAREQQQHHLSVVPDTGWAGLQHSLFKGRL